MLFAITMYCIYLRHLDNLHFRVFTSFLGHLRPPFSAGTLIVLVLVITPLPHVTLHWPQSDHADTIQSIAGPRLGSWGSTGGLGFSDFLFPFFLPFFFLLLFFLFLFFPRLDPFPRLRLLLLLTFLVFIVVTFMSPSMGVTTSFLELNNAVKQTTTLRFKLNREDF